MRGYRPAASSAARFAYGIELHAGLMQFPETVGAAAQVLEVNDALYAQVQKRLGLLVPVVKARAALRFAEYHVDSVLRSAFHAAQTEDGSRRGRIVQAVFPDGIREVTRPSGRAKVKQAKVIVDRLSHLNISGIDEYRHVWLPKIEAALTQLELALAVHKEAALTHQEAFAEEKALREAHQDVIDNVMGIVRATFPRDRRMQEVIFPLLQRAPSRQDDSPDSSEIESPSSAPL